MPSNPKDRAEREVEELRKLFAGSGTRLTRRSAHILRTASPVQPAQGTDARDPGKDSAEDSAEDAAQVQPQPIKHPAGATERTKAADQSAGVQDEHRGLPARSEARRGSPTRSPGSDLPPSEPPMRVPAGSVSSRHLAAEPLPAPPAPEPEPEPEHEPAPQQPHGDHEHKAPGMARPPSGAPIVAGVAPAPSAGERRPVASRRVRRVLLVAAAALAVALIGVFAFGMWLGRATVASQPAASPASGPSVATEPAATVTTAPEQATSPSACLATAQLGDKAIDLLVANKRGPELDRVLQTYVAASQRCRQTAQP